MTDWLAEMETVPGPVICSELPVRVAGPLTSENDTGSAAEDVAERVTVWPTARFVVLCGKVMDWGALAIVKLVVT